MIAGPAARPVFLVGFMGCGKTTCGRAVAESLGREFVDTDRLVAQREQRTVERIFGESGEAVFRDAERRALQSLDSRTGRVVATGGGTFATAANRLWMNRSGITVWLDVTLEEVRRRVGDGKTRPLWRPEDPVALRALFERRRAAYALCHVRVAVGTGNPARLAERVVREIL